VKSVSVITQILLIIGGLNWLLVGAFRFDLVAALVGLTFGQVSALSAIVYVLVGLSALYQAAVLVTGERSGSASPARRAA
jgi:hypothetical protein